jgi:hypothetical protein
MSYSGSVSYSEMILLYLYANHLLQKKSALSVLFKCSEGRSFESTYRWCGNNCDFSWKLMSPPLRKYSVFSYTSSIRNSARNSENTVKHNKLCKSML